MSWFKQKNQKEFSHKWSKVSYAAIITWFGVMVWYVMVWYNQETLSYIIRIVGARVRTSVAALFKLWNNVPCNHERAHTSICNHQSFLFLKHLFGNSKGLIIVYNSRLRLCMNTTLRLSFCTNTNIQSFQSELMQTWPLRIYINLSIENQHDLISI